MSPHPSSIVLLLFCFASLFLKYRIVSIGGKRAKIHRPIVHQKVSSPRCSSLGLRCPTNYTFETLSAACGSEVSLSINRQPVKPYYQTPPIAAVTSGEQIVVALYHGPLAGRFKDGGKPARHLGEGTKPKGKPREGEPHIPRCGWAPLPGILQFSSARARRFPSRRSLSPSPQQSKIPIHSAPQASGIPTLHILVLRVCVSPVTSVPFCSSVYT